MDNIKIKVYEPQSNWNSCVYLCRGLAIDRIAGRTTAPNESVLVVDSEQNAKLEYNRKNDLSLPIYRWKATWRNGIATSDWYMSEDEAEKSEVARTYPDDSYTKDGDYVYAGVEVRELRTSLIPPVKFPMVVNLEKGKDGRLFCRINLHPGLDGPGAAGIVCFPDRSMEGPCPGYALITGVKDKGTYGFLLGNMIQYGMPDKEAFLDWAWDNAELHAMDDISIINHPGLGKFMFSKGYVWIDAKASPYSKTVKGVWGGPYIRVSIPDDLILEDYVESTTSLEEMFLEEAFEDSVTRADLLSKFPLHNIFKRAYSELWQPSDKLMPDIVEQAIAEGVLNPVCLPGSKVYALELVRRKLFRLASFSPDEIDELVLEFARINNEAENTIKQKLKKGSLRIRTDF